MSGGFQTLAQNLGACAFPGHGWKQQGLKCNTGHRRRSHQRSVVPGQRECAARLNAADHVLLRVLVMTMGHRLVAGGQCRRGGLHKVKCIAACGAKLWS